MFTRLNFYAAVRAVVRARVRADWTSVLWTCLHAVNVVVKDDVNVYWLEFYARAQRLVYCDGVYAAVNVVLNDVFHASFTDEHPIFSTDWIYAE